MQVEEGLTEWEEKAVRPLAFPRKTAGDMPNERQIEILGLLALPFQQDPLPIPLTEELQESTENG